MRARILTALAALLLGGCEVQVGQGKVPPITVDVTVDLSGWRALPPSAKTFSAMRNVVVFPAAKSQKLKHKYGGKLGAIDGIDVDVERLQIVDEATQAAPLIPVLVTLAGVDVGGNGFVGRVVLNDDARKAIVAGVEAGEDVSLAMTATVTITPDAVPIDAASVHLRAQPILVVNALEAL